MINGQSILAVVPARGGSKGVPRKNLRVIGGKSLLAWTFEAAAGSVHLDRTILSSDDPEIIRFARSKGWDVPFVRDSRLATDEARTVDVILDALIRCPGYNWVVVLQPTSPLRTSHDIDRSIEICVERKAPACVSVRHADESPYWMMHISDSGHVVPMFPDMNISRRQELPPVYLLNGAVYVANTEWLIAERKFVTPETAAYVMPAERSSDIDTEDDILRIDAQLQGIVSGRH